MSATIVSEPPVVAIAGPTASGKTGLSLALRERLIAGTTGHAGAEIVSVDSAMVYRGMDIGTAKPDAETRARVPHHLIDILDPAESYSAARFAADAARLVGEIRARGQVPILVGGTMLYFRALFTGLSELPTAAPELRRRIEAEAARDGWPAMHARLADVDPAIAARLHPNDSQRIQRALEIHAASGRPASEWHAAGRVPAIGGPALFVALAPPDRQELHRRIESRLHGMIADGFVEEVAQLRARADLHAQLPSMRAVGYRQLWQHLAGDYDLDEAVQRCIFATRQYAKRQLTWLRAEQGWQWYDSTSPSIVDAVVQALQAKSRQGTADRA